jgi:uncharacterized membrane protein YfcA
MQLDLLSIALGACAAILVGFSKTGLPGTSIPAVALMAAAFPENAQLSVGAMLVVLLVGDIFAVSWYRRHAQWDRLLALFPFVVLGMAPAYMVLLWLDEKQFRPALGGLILLLLALEQVRRRSRWTRLPERRWFVGGAGFLAGFCSTVANAGGPVMTIYLLSRGLLKEQFIGTCAWFFFLLNLAKVVPFWTQDMLTAQTVGFGLALAPVAIAGALAGRWLVPRVPQRVFDLLVTLLAAAAAVWLIAG